MSDKPDLTPEVERYIQTLIRERLAEQAATHKAALDKAQGKATTLAEQLAALKTESTAWKADAEALRELRAKAEVVKAYKDAGLTEPPEDDLDLHSIIYERAKAKLPEAEREAFGRAQFLAAELAKEAPNPLISALRPAAPAAPGQRPGTPARPPVPPTAPRVATPAPNIATPVDPKERYNKLQEAIRATGGDKAQAEVLLNQYRAEVMGTPNPTTPAPGAAAT